MRPLSGQIPDPSARTGRKSLLLLFFRKEGLPSFAFGGVTRNNLA
jgi:hypothetical protein